MLMLLYDESQCIYHAMLVYDSIHFYPKKAHHNKHHDTVRQIEEGHKISDDEGEYYQALENNLDEKDITLYS